ncbi:general substrate transporter [Stipitochalara longipes BDJ]|nr:general substrate transporter [Stipitochalara longipes BDJ]
MSALDEKTQDDEHVEVEDLSPDAAMKDTEALHNLRGTDALMVAIRIEPVRKLGKGMIQLYAICALMMLGASMGGYDASLMGNLLAMPHFQSTFGSSILGVKAGLISAMFSIGSVCALPFIGPAADTWGRRAGIGMGCTIIIMGTIVQGTAHHLPQYLAGRFFLGFGGGIAGAGPAYVVEIAHPVYRGVIAGLFNCCYYVGAVLAAVVLRGCVRYDSNISWTVPTWFQLALPSILLIGCFFIPESPRWQYSHGQIEKCRATLTKYHGDGNPESVYVQLQMQEFGEWIELEGSDKRWWDYRALFNSKASLYRVLLCACAVPAFSQWTGQGGVSYFLPAMLTTMSITSTDVVLDINLGIAIASGISAAVGASFMDRFGRRKMLISCCAVLTLTWVGMIACTSSFYSHGNTAAAKASVAFIFLIGIVFSFAYTPLQQLYPAETLSFEQRAKGLAFAAMCTNATALVNLFATPITLQKIAWKTYGIWLASCALQGVYYYVFMVETKGHTLEEMDEIFKSKNPRAAASIRKEQVDEAVAKVKGSD